MNLRRANRSTKRIIDFVHMAAASVWLGGFVVLFALTLDGGASLGFEGCADPSTIEAFRRKFIVPCIPLLMGTAVLYGVFTSWGFFKHGWLIAKWALTVALIAGFSLVPYSTASVGAALAGVIALFALSVFKPSAKGSKNTKRAPLVG